MSKSSTSAAATSSCVESGFDAQRTTSAPPAFSVRIKFAVSVVTCRHADTRWPASGCSASKRSRIAASTGICRSAHSIRTSPSSASAMSLTSWRRVVAIRPNSTEGLVVYAAVLVLEAHDVLELRRRDFEDRRVLDRGDAVDRPRREPERGAGADDLALEHRLPHVAELKLRPTALHVPAFVFLAMELEAERAAGADEEQLPDVLLGMRPEELVAPGLLDPLRLEREA